MVYFVGAGPGDPDLITVRGQELLKRADEVIYAGSLVDPRHLRVCKEGCRFHNSAHMTLEEVLKVMETAEAKGLMTVRLHTGDPCLYGAIREQMDALDAKGIAYESCPGVSSFCGAAAAMDLEYTLPGVSQSVIISRAGGRTPVPEKEKIRDLAAHQATMVFFLSAGHLEELSEELMMGGYPAASPAAIVYRASWPDQKVVRCTVCDLPWAAEREGITKTALVIIGDVLDSVYERSRLYDPAFTTGFRKGKDNSHTEQQGKDISHGKRQD